MLPIDVVSAKQNAEILSMISDGTITRTSGKEILDIIIDRYFRICGKLSLDPYDTQTPTLIRNLNDFVKNMGIDKSGD